MCLLLSSNLFFISFYILCDIKPKTLPTDTMDSCERLKAMDQVFARVDLGKPWVKCPVLAICRLTDTTIIHVQKNHPAPAHEYQEVDQYSIAYVKPIETGFYVAKRVIAGPDDQNLLPGIVAAHSDNRCLVFMDDGQAKYFELNRIYPIIVQSLYPWQDLHNENKEKIKLLEAHLRDYFSKYPSKILLKAQLGEIVDIMSFDGNHLKTALVIDVDKDIYKLRYKDGTDQYVYRGSPRLVRSRLVPSYLLSNQISFDHIDPKLGANIYKYHNNGQKAISADLECEKYVFNARENTALRGRPKKRFANKTTVYLTDDEDLLRVALSSDDSPKPNGHASAGTTSSQAHSNGPTVNPEEDIINADSHKECTVECFKEEAKVNNLVDGFRDVSDLKIPMILGWKRHIRFDEPKSKYQVVYVAPCGRVFNMAHLLQKYLCDVGSKFDIDYFSYDVSIRLDREPAEFDVCRFDENIAVDRVTRQPLERKNVSLMNLFNNTGLGDDFTYCNTRCVHPNLERNGFTFNEEFKSGCSCEFECLNRSACPCHQINEYAFGIAYNRGHVDRGCQYMSKKLFAQRVTGIYECNSMCSCSSKCPNRVVQNGMRFRLQLRWVLAKGWGVFTLDDIPAGSFIASYEAEVLDEETMGDFDVYYADLDYIKSAEAPKRSQPDHVSLHSLLGDDQVYTLDASTKGNVGRFFNHCCFPNMFVQNVFIETHDPRFPHIAFFASTTIFADEELTWDYGYEVGSVPDRIIWCNCYHPQCSGRLL